ncbi:interleukin-23 receptor isoform X2 [Centropristis striata]|uniref:interleukin-23 receptor isoform X2 n=1 Tax=Centropristis striata TaxID=184440 RepID=UPI0027DF5081|nr:interleukin-23 receptor isoform X2 [Centropristis striata]
MNPASTCWRLFIILLCFSIRRPPLLPADCQLFIPLGDVTVKPAPVFLIGSNLTVYCHIPECQRSYELSLELNDKPAYSAKRVNCTTMKLSLNNVQMPRSKVICKRMRHQISEVVNGVNLRGGFPPDKPENINCETSRSSDVIDCSCESGQKTHINTSYSVSLTRDNGSQILLKRIQKAGEITVPRAMIDENTKYWLVVSAHNELGASRSDPFLLRVRDIMIPETPHILRIEFGNNSRGAVLLWRTSEPSETLTADVRLRSENGSWESGEGTEVGGGLIHVGGLRPLTGYEFQMRTCSSPSGPPRSATPGWRSTCSRWSTSVAGRSPGRGPSEQLHVWRKFGVLGADGRRAVTVLWKPLSPEDHSGAVQQYKVFMGNNQKQEEFSCGAALSRCVVQVPADIRTLSISAVTLYGTSPPADVPLRNSGDVGAVLGALAAADGGGVFVSWSTTRGEPLHYVVEWTSVPSGELQWQKVAKDQNSTLITGLAAGVRYNVSVFAVTTRGVSAPSHTLLYAQEKKPVSGPRVSVLVHEARRVWIEWDELPVDQRRGFITNYTVYLQTLDSRGTQLSVTVSGSAPRRTWLDCPEGALALQMTASTSAGEGERGNRVCSQPDSPAVSLVIVFVFIITLFIVIIANLMCWSCVRERIKQKCISWGPAWLDEKLPKPGNSNAIRLLEQDGSELSFSSSHSDPPLSPISLISQEERDDIYPTIHLEIPGPSGPPETPLLMSDPGTVLVDSLLEHAGYKPQIVTLSLHPEEVTETEEEVSSSGEEEDRCMFGGFLGGFLSGVEVSDPPLGLTLSSVSGLLWPKSHESDFNGRLLLESHVEADSPSLESHRGEIMTPDSADCCLSQFTAETTLTAGYFPQVAAVSSSARCDTQR